MPVQIEKVSPCEKKLKFTVSPNEINVQIEKVLKKVQKTAKLKGFRKGKAPLSLIRKTYWSHVQYDVINEVIQDSYQKAVVDNKVPVVGRPKIETKDFNPDQDFHFEALVEIYPEFELPKLSKIKVSEVKVELKEEEIEENLKQIRESHAVMKPLEGERALQAGDFAEIDFSGKLPDGTEPDSMKASAFLLEIGSNQFIPGFEEGLVGMKLGEERDVEVKFPEDYHAKEYAGVLVTFHVKLGEIKVKELPELTDDFAKTIDYDTVEALKTEIRENMQKGKEQEARAKMREEAFNQLVEKAEMRVPEAMIQGQEEIIRNDISQRLRQQGSNEMMTKDYFEKWKSDIESQALKQVKVALLVDKIATENSLEASEGDLDARFEELAQSFSMEKEKIKEMFTKDPNRMGNLKWQIKEDKVTDFIFTEIKLLDPEKKGIGSLFSRGKK